MKRPAETIERAKAAREANRAELKRKVREALNLKPKHPPMGALLPHWSGRNAA